MFLAYLFMGIPAGVVLKRTGYRFTSLLAIGVGAGLFTGRIDNTEIPLKIAEAAGFSRF